MSIALLHKQILGERKNVIIPRLYIELLGGDYVAAVVFKEIVYWSGDWADTDQQDGWFYRTAEEWARDHFLSWAQVNRGLARINDLIDPDEDGVPLVERKTRKIRNRDGSLRNETATHYRLNQDLYAAVVTRGRGDSWNSTNSNSGNWTNPDSGNGTKSNSLTSSTPDTPPETAQKGMRVGKETDEFAAFYDAYPRKKARADAWRAWRTLKPDPALIETIMAALEAQVRVNWHDTDPRYIPYPASWLRAERWKDEIEAPRPKPAANRVVADHAATDQVDWFGKYGGQQR